MKRGLITIVSVIGFAIALAACSQSPSAGTHSAPNANTWNGAPTGAASRITLRKGQSGFLALEKWSINAASSSGGNTFTLAPSAAHHPAAFSLAGSGSAVAQEIFSPILSVAPGRAYTFSALVDASKVESGTTFLWVSNVKRDQLFGSAQVPARQKGRFGFTVRIPQGVHQIRVGYYTGGSRVQKGAALTFSQPAITNS